MLLIIISLLLGTYLFLDWIIRLLKVTDYPSKFVLVTGCDSGFGRDLAIRLDSMGFPVFAACLAEDGRRDLEKTCSSRLVTLSLNVTDNDSIREALQTVKQKLPHENSLWAVVNNAGVVGNAGAAEMCSHADYLFACSVNLFGPIEVSRVFLPLLRKSRGRIVMITSVVGRMACASGPYVVSKYGLEGFSDVIRRQVARFGIKVSMLEPGFFRTSMTDVKRLVDSVSQGHEKAEPDVQEAYGKEYVKWSGDLIAKARELTSPDTFKVVDAYVAAITSVYPRPRYVVGHDARFFLVPLSYLPEWVADWALAFFVGKPAK